MLSRLVQRGDSPAYGWVVLGIFTLNYSLIDVSALTIGLLLPEISDEMGLSPSQQGWLSSSVVFANLAFEIPANLWLSRYRPWRIASITFLAAAGFTALNGLAPTFTILLAMRLALGMSYVICKVPRTLVILQWIPKRRIALANGVMFSVIDSLGGVGFVMIPLIMIAFGGWRNTLYVWAAITLASAFVWMLFGKDRFTPEYRAGIQSQVGSPLTSLFRYKEPWILGFGAAGSVSARFAFTSFWPTFAQDEYGLSLAYSGLVIGLISTASTPGKIAVAVVPSLANNPAPVLLACGLMVWGSFVGMLYTGSTPLLFGLGAVNGIGFAYIPLVMTKLYQLPGIRPRELAVAVSLFFTLLWVGGVSGPLMVGFIQEATDDLRFALVIVSFTSLALSLSGVMLVATGRRNPSMESVGGSCD